MKITEASLEIFELQKDGRKFVTERIVGDGGEEFIFTYLCGDNVNPDEVLEARKLVIVEEEELRAATAAAAQVLDSAEKKIWSYVDAQQDENLKTIGLTDEELQKLRESLPDKKGDQATAAEALAEGK